MSKLQAAKCTECGKIYFDIPEKDLYLLCINCKNKFLEKMYKLWEKNKTAKETSNERT